MNRIDSGMNRVWDIYRYISIAIHNLHISRDC